MVDVVFELAGDRLPAHYHPGVWRALAAALPWLADDSRAGVHEVRGVRSHGEYLLPRRARLTIRVSQSHGAEAAALAGREFEIEGDRVQLGRAALRPIAPHPTLGAAMVVTGASDELAHQVAVADLLEAAGLPQRFICGRMRDVPGSDGRVLRGAEVVVHELRDDDSVALQCSGLGPERRLGCGLFVPHKVISGIG